MEGGRESRAHHFNRQCARRRLPPDPSSTIKYSVLTDPCQETSLPIIPSATVCLGSAIFSRKGYAGALIRVRRISLAIVIKPAPSPRPASRPSLRLASYISVLKLCRNRVGDDGSLSAADRDLILWFPLFDFNQISARSGIANNSG